MNDSRIRKRLCISGMIQGVGFRPFIFRRARSCGLTGWVRNDLRGVTLEIEGLPKQLERFTRGIRVSTPPLAVIDEIVETRTPLVHDSAFVILSSETRDHGVSPVAADVAVCDECLQELRDLRNRRFRYPFINCTNCGPRFTIIKSLPYDRASTTMQSFTMCGECRREYEDSADRRFHAQPNACQNCGPRIWFRNASESGEHARLDAMPGQCESALQRFSEAITAGEIVAVKGIGGFHLVCDATNRSAIRALRKRKGRIAKPLAIMVADVDAADAIALFDDSERMTLESVQRPVVLLRKRDGSELAKTLSDLAPHNDFIGIMLPYSPLHHLLCEDRRPLVMTSANFSEDPIVRTNAEATSRLSTIADCYLFHDRDIEVACDDSVVRCVDDTMLPIRRSRGYAPVPVQLPSAGPDVLAVGGEMKSAICITKGEHAYVSQHLGDIGSGESLATLRRNVDHLMELFRVKVAAVACDLHPNYLSVEFACELARSFGTPLIGVQHHHAHACALRAEHRLSNDHPLIACCFDGTGFGIDGTIWGGEFMTATGIGFRRVAHIESFPLPGGDAAIKKPYRTALALLWAHRIAWCDRLPSVIASKASERELLRQQIAKGINCVATSSVGRLFDAVASLIGIRHEVHYEAQAAIELESLALHAVDHVEETKYKFLIEDASPITVRTETVVRQICNDVLEKRDRSEIAGQFHHAVANMIGDVCVALRKQTGVNTIGLTGGVFQNALLLRLTTANLKRFEFDVRTHRLVPPNDGGLAIGQALVAQEQLLAGQRS